MNKEVFVIYQKDLFSYQLAFLHPLHGHNIEQNNVITLEQNKLILMKLNQ